MKKLNAISCATLFALVATSQAQGREPLQLSETIALPGIEGTSDHFGVDLKANRLLLCLQDAALVEVFDLSTNKLIHTITGFKRPHAIFVRPEIDKMFVVDGEASEVKIFQRDSYNLIGRVQLTIDADPIAYDASTKYLWVVNGGREAHTPYCLLSIVDTTSDKKLADIKLPTNRLESMAIEKSGTRLFINMTGNDEIGVVDRTKSALIATWPVTAGKQNVPMAFDEARHRLFVATRIPSKVVVFDTESGKEITSVPTAGSADDLAYDAAHQRLYVACGEGSITVIEQRGADDYQTLENIPTGAKAKNGILVPELSRYYLFVPKQGDQEAGVRVFDVLP